MFNVRLLTLDHYLSKPIPELFSNYDDNGKSSSAPEPVLRIFGPTLSGEKACVHIHGVYPYLYVPYEGGENPDRDALLLAAGLDRALQASSKQNQRFNNSFQRYVHRVRLVSGIPMYGYHSRPRQFFKVYFFNPYSIRKAAELLLSGAILNMKLQPHETHIPFTQQFMIDFNLFGMNVVNFKKVMHRQNTSAPDSLSTVDKENILPSHIKRTSYCFFEVDVLAEDILNRLEDCNAAANPGLVGIWEEEKARRRMRGRESELTQCHSDPRPFHIPHGVEVDFLIELKQRLANISNDEKEYNTTSDDLKTPYPAELPENSVIMEASILDASSADEEVDLYKSQADLINETIVQELSQRLGDSVEAVEDDSWNSADEHMDLNQDGRGDGVDPEGEEAELDMTQPLSPPTGWTAVCEKPGNSSGESEDEFWKEMADDLIQMDGAGDSDCDPQFSLGTGLPDPLSHLPNNLLSFLDEHCLDFQTDQSAQQIWDASDTWSPWSYSPLSDVPTPISNIDPSHEGIGMMVALNDGAPATPESASSDPIYNNLEGCDNGEEPRSNQDLWTNLKNLISSKSDSSNSLTLREYLKGDVVHVDFKVINAQEMVVIEYSPHENKTTGQNKFLVKPLYQFVEDWNRAEVTNTTNHRPKYINGFTPLNKKKVVSKKQQEKERVDKQCQTLFENIESMNNNKSYSINESVISKKKITLKLVTSQSTFQENSNNATFISQPISNDMEPGNDSNMEIVYDSAANSKLLNSSSCMYGNKLPNPSLDGIENVDAIKIVPKKEPNNIEIHDDLVKNVNEKFEEYYQRLIGKKKPPDGACVKTEHEVINVSDSSTSTDCDTEPDHFKNVKSNVIRKKCLSSRKKRSRKSRINPVDFVSQILSNYSKMPKSSNLPPMSITVNIGDPNMPVRVNMQPNSNYFDGADDSSSDDALQRKPKTKKTKYRPLQVLVQQSPIRNRRKRKDDASSSCNSQSESYIKPKSENRSSAKRNVSSPCCSSVGEIPVNATLSEPSQTSESVESKTKKLRRSARCAKISLASSMTAMEQISPEIVALPSKDDNVEIFNKSVKDIPQTDMLASSSDDQCTIQTQLKKKENKCCQLNQLTGSKAEEKANLINNLSPPFLSQTLTQYIKNQGSESETSFSNFPSSEESRQIFTSQLEMVPKRRVFTYNVVPPTKSEILSSLNECDVLESTGTIPYYSNYKDAKAHMEVGNKVLKLEHPLSRLKQHHSTLSITGIEEYRKLAMKGQDVPKGSLVKDRSIFLTPILIPPTRKEILDSSEHYKKTTRVLTPKVKMLAPAGDESNSGDESMSLTPCTPSILSDNSPSCTPIAPQLSQNKNISPDVTEMNIIQRRVSFDDIVETIPLQSTPNRPRSMSQAKIERIASLGKIKSKRRLLLNKFIDNRRLSVESNKSTDIFENEIVCNVAKDSSNDGNAKMSANTSSDSKNRSCLIQGVSLNNTFGFKTSLQNFQEAKPHHNFQFTSLLVIEVLTEAREKMFPDPQCDAILAIFYALVLDYPTDIAPPIQSGVFVVGCPLTGAGVKMKVESFTDEKSLIGHLVQQLRYWDPDIVAGYEIEKGSWGYLLQRAYVIGINLIPQLGRTMKDEKDIVTMETDEEADDIPKVIRHLKIPGRVILNVWRLLRHEIALTSYSFESIMFHLMHERHPQLSPLLLAQLWVHHHSNVRYIPAEYCMKRVLGVCRILAQLDLVSRNSELAKVFGIQFEEVLSRGSQFRVESMMLRLAKPLNFVPVSPDMQQRAHMRAPGSLPLIMEPESSFYADPVIVLDFQSLYPSMIIAHNYCFSTCLGRVTHLGRGSEPFEFGCTRLSIPSGDLVSLSNGNIHVSPAGVAFVRANIRKGILPSMLEEILDTRLMVKKSMKENKGDKLLQKVLHARQLGLKLIANVTYGYTAANFSGRMPCIEVGDSVVSKGRETLQRAIRLVQSTSRWGARVVYGDTDSLFVLTPGRTRQQAFQIGEEIANAVTQDNPRPVKLKLEKVYQPCILQTKKRYVGYMYENAEQVNPVYEAKGIETVRRDGCPATAKILQKALHILFDTGDVSLVKKYTLQQFAKIFQERVNLQDLIFAKEYRGRRGYRPGACVPALQLAKQWTSVDRRAEPRNKERVAYVIVHGAPGVPLIRLVRSPRDLLSDPNLRIHSAYYITKAIIPPLQRCFTLIGADPLAWYAEMPRRYHRMVRSGLVNADKRTTISQYFESLDCVSCGRLTQQRVCSFCLSHPAVLMTSISMKIRKWERAQNSVLDVCRSCCSRNTHLNCISLDCPVLYRRHQINNDALQVPILRDICKNNVCC